MSAGGTGWIVTAAALGLVAATDEGNQLELTLEELEGHGFEDDEDPKTAELDREPALA